MDGETVVACVEFVFRQFRRPLWSAPQRGLYCAGAICRSVLVGLLFAIGTFLVGCGSYSAPAVPPIVASISVHCSSSSIIVSTSATCTATAKDSSGHSLNYITFAWTSSPATVASISSNGTAMGLLAGATQITASANGIMSAPFSLTVTAGFLLSGGLGTARIDSTATLLNNGMVLIAGGNNSGSGTDSLTNAELYNPATGTFTPTGSMHVGHNHHTATLLDDGRVLIAGGITTNGAGIATAEVYNPATSTFSLTFDMNSPRWGHTATLLPDGTVLIASGIGTSAEIFDPSANAFIPTGSMIEEHQVGAAVLLNDGKVLVAGGLNQTGYTATAEVFDPVVGAFTRTGSMNSTRDLFTATLLNDGRVLVAGGISNANVSSGAELYDPDTGVFTPTNSLNVGRCRHTATLLTNGTVLITGGDLSSTTEGPAGVELYDPSAGTFTTAGSLNTVRSSHTATLLPNGTILIVGGTTAEVPKPGEEIYEPGSLTPAGLQSITVRPANASISTGTRQRLVATGTSAAGTQQLASAVWTSSAPTTVLISNDVSNRGAIQIVAVPPSGGSVTVTASLGSVQGSTTVNVNP